MWLDNQLVITRTPLIWIFCCMHNSHLLVTIKASDCYHWLSTWERCCGQCLGCRDRGSVDTGRGGSNYQVGSPRDGIPLQYSIKKLLMQYSCRTVLSVPFLSMWRGRINQKDKLLHSCSREKDCIPLISSANWLLALQLLGTQVMWIHSLVRDLNENHAHVVLLALFCQATCMLAVVQEIRNSSCRIHKKALLRNHCSESRTAATSGLKDHLTILLWPCCHMRPHLKWTLTS